MTTQLRAIDYNGFVPDEDIESPAADPDPYVWTRAMIITGIVLCVLAGSLLVVALRWWVSVR